MSFVKSKVSKFCAIMYTASITDMCGLNVLYHSCLCLILCTVLNYEANIECLVLLHKGSKVTLWCYEVGSYI